MTIVETTQTVNHPRWSINANSAARFLAECKEAATNDIAFSHFQQLPEISDIMATGGDARWASYIDKVAPGLLHSCWSMLKLIDSVGSAEQRTVDVLLSPTILLKVGRVVTVRQLFGITAGSSIAEIGAGYGGFAAVLQALCGKMDYTIYDLPEPRMLQQKYLAACGHTTKTGDPDTSASYDLVISDYAFSELPYWEQKRYADNILSKSKNGTMIWNVLESFDTDAIHMAKDVLPLMHELLPMCDIKWGPNYSYLFDGIPPATTTLPGCLNYLLFWHNPTI